MMMNERTCISSDRLPPAVGPYTPAVAWGDLVFCSGQIPLDPATGKLVTGDIETQARQALTNLSHLLAAAGSGTDRVLKTTVFLQDMDDFARVNAVYAEFFPTAPPARSCVQVARLPLGAGVEVEAIAVRDNAG